MVNNYMVNNDMINNRHNMEFENNTNNNMVNNWHNMELENNNNNNSEVHVQSKNFPETPPRKKHEYFFDEAKTN